MTMTEDTIERRVERYFDHIDQLLMRGAIDQATYDKCAREISERAEAQHQALERCK